MKLRQNIAALIALIFLVGCMILYLMTDLTLPERHSMPAEYHDNKWLRFETRLRQIEKDLNKHTAAVGEIKQVIQGLKPVQFQSPLNDVYHDSSPDECTFQVQYAPKTNVQMLDLYEELKFDNLDGGVWKQGFKIKYKKEQWNKHHKLKVFVMPHSHNDPGWRVTFEEYYKQKTRQIFTHMIEHLQKQDNWKFIWAEISFLALWWSEIGAQEKEIFKMLVNSKQIEIVTGGWVMNDEANTHWNSMLMQLTEGHQWLKKNLNITPHNGWTIDPFGESPTMPLLLRLSGFDNLVIQRTHYSIKKQLASNKQLEFRWRQLWDDSGKYDLFTHMMPFYSYDVPHTCGPDPKVCCQFDFMRLHGSGVTCPWKVAPQVINNNNVEFRANLLLDQYRKKSMLYQTNVIFAPLGDDFRYAQDTEWENQYSNYQKLIDYMNSNEALNVEIKFGTLEDYFKAVREEMAMENFPTLSGDFFTYADRDDHYWSGYYTSRPFYKRMDRVLLSYIRAAEILSVLAANSDHSFSNWIFNKDSKIEDKLALARQSLSLFQHHDGITGTAKDHVVIDYGDKMLQAINDAQYVMQHSINVLVSKNGIFPQTEDIFYNFDDMRMTQSTVPTKRLISFKDDERLKNVLIFNPLTFSRNEVVTLVCQTPHVEVRDSNKNLVQYQISPIFEDNYILPVETFEIAFVVEIPALGFAKYSIYKKDSSDFLTPSSTFAKITINNFDGEKVALPIGFKDVEIARKSAGFSIHNSQTTASFNDYGLLKALKIDSVTYPVHLDFAKYGVRKASEKSGAYLFLPDGDAEVLETTPTPIEIIEGPIYSSVYISLPFLRHKVYLYKSSGADNIGLEIHNLVDIRQYNNFELVMRLSTNIKNKNEFFTDLNAFQMIRRRTLSKLPLQANYYPLPAMAYIEDSNVRLSVITAGPLGVAALKEGQIEVMQERRLMQDDNRGLGQGVTDNHATPHIFKIILEKKTSENCQKIADNHPSGFPSLAAYVSAQTLQNPLYSMFPTNEYSIDLYKNDRPSLDLDISMPVLRGSILTSEREDNVGLIFARQYLNLCFASHDYFKQLPINTGKVNIDNFLPEVKYLKAYESSLTFMNVSRRIHSNTDQDLCPMEPKAFLLQR